MHYESHHQAPDNHVRSHLPAQLYHYSFSERKRGQRELEFTLSPFPAACVKSGGSRREKFRGSMSKLSVWLSTLRGGGRPPPRQTRFRLLASSTGWDWLPPESRRKVSEVQSLHPFPLSQASPGAMTPFLLLF